jgi:hypothetical protein
MSQHNSSDHFHPVDERRGGESVDDDFDPEQRLRLTPAGHLAVTLLREADDDQAEDKAAPAD